MTPFYGSILHLGGSSGFTCGMLIAPPWNSWVWAPALPTNKKAVTIHTDPVPRRPTPLHNTSNLWTGSLGFQAKYSKAGHPEETSDWVTVIYLEGKIPLLKTAFIHENNFYITYFSHNKSFTFYSFKKTNWGETRYVPGLNLGIKIRTVSKTENIWPYRVFWTFLFKI